MDTVKSLSVNDIYLIVTGIIMGTSARIFMLKVDTRQIPSYPSAFFNIIVFGFIAASLGSIAIPAIMARDFTAITFLTLAITQFREVRKTERESLGKLEQTEYARRGEAYIDGISKTFESRNYIALITSLFTVIVMKIVGQDKIWVSIVSGIVAGGAVAYLCYRFTKGKTIGQICDISIGTIEVRGSELFVDNMYVTNYLGTEKSRQIFTNEGISAVLTPREPRSRLTLENYGQRQAILFEAVRALGIKRYKFMHRHFPSGKIIIAIVPIINDRDKFLNALTNTPILENSRKVARIMKTSSGGNNG